MTTDCSQNANEKTGRRPIAVLLVAEQRFVGLAVGRLLNQENDIELHCCYVATEAVDCAHRVAPTVILQDLVMPDIEGATLIGHYRSNPSTAATPIVALAGAEDSATRARALAAGANDYLVKLPDRDTLVACVRRHHLNGETGLSAPDSPPAGSTAGHGNETLDRAVLAELRDIGGADGAEFLTGLIDQFVEEGASLVDRIKHAAPQLDTAVLIAAAHSLKGASMTMGARRLAAMTAQLEYQMGQPRVPLDLTLIVAIDDEFARVRHACLQERNGERSLA